MNGLLRKELLLLWRSRAHLFGIFLFGAITLLLFSFGVGPDAALLRKNAAGFLWIALLLASTLTLSESFHSEMENRAMEGLVLLPVDPALLFYAKALVNALQMTLLGFALLPLMVVLYGAGTSDVLMLVLVVVLGAFGIAAPGTLYGAMTAQVRTRQMLLPLLLFPLLVPALLSAVKLTSLLIQGDPMQQIRSWLALLAAFDAIYWSLCGLLYGRVIDE